MSISNEQFTWFIKRFSIEKISMADMRARYSTPEFSLPYGLSASHYIKQEQYQNVDMTIPNYTLDDLIQITYQHNEEMNLINQNPTVKAAYDQYLTTVSLCKEFRR